MPRVYELPTHLQVEDQLIAGLTARQLLRLAIGASLGYGVWDQASWLPDEVRLGLAGALAICGVLFALLQPFGRPLDQWLLAGLLFAVLPRRLAWRPGTLLVRELPEEQPGWAELELRPEWPAVDRNSRIEPSRYRSRSPSCTGGRGHEPEDCPRAWQPARWKTAATLAGRSELGAGEPDREANDPLRSMAATAGRSDLDDC